MQTLPTEIQAQVSDYVRRDVADATIVDGYFDFIRDDKLRNEVVAAYTGARYIYKLGQALGCSGEELQAHSKFQITQNASIFEAVVTYLLENDLKDHVDVKKLYEDIEYTPINIPISLKDKDGNDAVICTKKKNKNKTTIQFDKKVDCLIGVGAVHGSLGPDIKRCYSLRNGMHLQNAVKNTIRYDIEQSKLSYRRIRPFLAGIKGFLSDGKLPDNAVTAAALKSTIAARKSSKG